MLAFQEVQARIRETTPHQRAAAAATSLAVVALFFSIGGLAGVWWAGSFEMKHPHSTVEIEYVSTLWEVTTKTTMNGQSKEETRNIDDGCGESNLNDETKSRCDKIGAVRTFAFFEFITCIASVACPTIWLLLEARQNGGGFSHLQKGLLISAVSCAAFASLWALLAAIIASTLDFGDLNENVGVNGGGFVLVILSMVLCLVPGIVLEVLAWRWAYQVPATTTAARPVDLPKVAELPNLVSPTVLPERKASAIPRGDFETAVIGCQQSGADLEASKADA